MSIEETRHKVNVQYKDRLFKFIFQEPEFALSLVNALTGMEYKDPKEVEITTLEDVLYINMKNDVSICIHSSMFLFEHQSTFSFNLPYRCLEYGSKLLSQYVEAHHLDVYARKAIELPEVYSIVFYNGLEERPDRETITLEVNRKKERRTAVHKSILKLKGSIQSSVEIININKGHNVRFMKMCKPLREYCWMIEGMRRKIRYGESAEQAAKEVLDSMPQEYGIYDKIMVHRKEVAGMLETEFDQKKWEKRFTDDGIEIGLEKGIEQGIEQGKKQKAEQTCRKMLANAVYTLDMIKELTGFTEEEILSIKKEIKM